MWQQQIPQNLRDGMEYIVLGSGGRGEDFLHSDLDHAVVLAPSLAPEDVGPFLSNFIGRMQNFGYPLCQGFVMSTNPRWIGTTLEWQTRIQGYFDFPDWENARYLFMTLDGVPLSASSRTWTEIVDPVWQGVRESPFICWEMAHLGIHRTVALDVFGHLRKVSGSRGEAVNIKDGYLNPMVHSIRLLAIVNGCSHTSTLDRMKCLAEQGVFPESWLARIESALEFGWAIRLAAQVADLRSERPVSDCIHLGELDSKQKEQLVHHLETAKQLERWVHRRFTKPR
ncbi:MAG: hypothetical protein A2201_03945 [Alicyclobacillus sp. RIFOXYA1_FULL_53_8]|nr:MAG: hypothetical protein A2201_03945 [Alicyclobacillus sp. RIFOXYA1_FULL_53_8]